jgi:hypothetical protein
MEEWATPSAVAPRDIINRRAQTFTLAADPPQFDDGGVNDHR